MTPVLGVVCIKSRVFFHYLFDELQFELYLGHISFLEIFKRKEKDRESEDSKAHCFAML